MRIANFITAFWHTEAEASEKGEGPFGLRQWLINTRNLFSPEFSLIACGTYSNPKWSPLPSSVSVVNSGLQFTKPYEHHFWSYAGAAQTAANAYLLNREDWDLAVNLDNDCLVGAVDFDSILREFADRPELLLTPDWHGRPGGPFVVWKREGVARWQHMRRRANLIELIDNGYPETLPPLIEDELGDIFKGLWWNAWGDIPTMRQDFGLEFEAPEREPLEKSWPFCRQPNPAIIEEFTRTQTSQTKPCLAG